MQLSLFLGDARKWLSKRLATSESSDASRTRRDAEPSGVPRRIPPGGV